MTTLRQLPKFFLAVAALALVAGLPVLLLSLVTSTSPLVLQDELVYSLQARHMALSSGEFGNYLHALVFGLTDICGPEFYSCARALNIVFWFGQVAGIFLMARQFLGLYISALVTAAWSMGPVVVYNLLFMPDVMYGCLVIWSLYFGVRAIFTGSKERQLIFVGLSVLSAALAANTKPHIIFLLPALLLIWHTSDHRQAKTRKAWLQTGLFFVLFWALKLLVGFSLAGPSGFNVLPAGYAPWGPGRPETPYSSWGHLGGGDLPVGEEASLIAALPLQLLLYVGVLVFAIGPLLVALTSLKLSLWKAGDGVDDLDQTKNLAMSRLLLFSLNAILLGLAFQIYLTVSGDDHSDRVLLRHAEPFLFVVLIGAVWALWKFDGAGPRRRLVPVILVLAGVLPLIIGVVSQPRVTITDSMLAVAVSYNGVWIVNAALSLVAALSIFFNLSGRILKATALVSLGLVPVMGLGLISFVTGSQNKEGSGFASTGATVVSAGITSNQTLTIVAPERQAAGGAAFVYGGSNFNLRAASIGRVVKEADLDGAGDFILLAPTVLVSPDTLGFRVIDSSSEHLLLIRSSEDGPLGDALPSSLMAGLRFASPYALSANTAVSTGEFTDLIAEPPFENSEAEIQLSLDPAVSNRQVVVSVGGDSATIELPADGSSVTLSLNMIPNGGDQTISFQSASLKIRDPVLGRDNEIGLRFYGLDWTELDD